MERKKITFKSFWQVLKQAFADFSDDKVMKLSAALSYYTVFAIAPMLIVIITLCDFFFGKQAIEGTIYGQIRSFVGDSTALQIQDMIKNAVKTHSSGIAGLGIITLILAATGVFTEIQDSINFIWDLRAKPKSGILKMLMNRLLSFSMIIGLAFILMVSLVINGLVSAFSNKLLSYFPHVAVSFTYVFNIVLMFATITFLFGVIFKVLPDAKIKWKDVLFGSAVTAVLFMAGKFGIGFYLGQTSVSSTYGAAGSLVILLLWVYYSAVILYFGAEFTKAYATILGKHIYPSEFAVYVQKVEVESNDSLQDQKNIKATNKEDAKKKLEEDS